MQYAIARSVKDKLPFEFANLFALSDYKTGSVRQFRNNGNWQFLFRRNLTGSSVDRYYNLLNIIGRVVLGEDQDVKECILESNLQFTVKYLYVFLNFGGIEFQINCV